MGSLSCTELGTAQPQLVHTYFHLNLRDIPKNVHIIVHSSYVHLNIHFYVHLNLYINVPFDDHINVHYHINVHINVHVIIVHMLIFIFKFI